MKKNFISIVVMVSLIGSFGVVPRAEHSGRDIVLGACMGALGMVLVGGVVAPILLSRQGNARGDVDKDGFENDETESINQEGAEDADAEFEFSYIVSHGEQRFAFLGQDKVLVEVSEFFDAVLSFETYEELGAQKPKALFIEGSRGNGKTLLAKYITSELNCCMIPVNGYFLADEATGPAEAKIQFLFDFARKLAQEKLTVLFIDDFDVFGQKSDFYQLNVPKRKAMHELIQQITHLDNDDNVIVIAAATSIIDLDDQLFKPGCFDSVIHIPLPTREGRMAILKDYFDDIELDELCWSETFLEEVADNTAGFTALRLKNIPQQAAFLAGQGSMPTVTREYVDKACKQAREKKQMLVGEKKEETFFYTFSQPTRFSDVIGHDEVLVEVKELVDFLKNPAHYLAIGARGSRGVLLYGPSGCGKTLLARALAGEAGCCFISISGSGFVKKYVGTGAMTVRRIFSFARKMAKEVPVIIFIDEIDGLGHRRSLDASGGQTEYNNTINEILKQMDGFEQNENIIVVGATNLLSELDDALTRPGRFDRKIMVPLPTKKSRAAILEYFLHTIKLVPELVIEEVATEFAKRTIGFSGAALENFVNEAAMLAARANGQYVTIHNFEQALDKIILGLKTNLDRSPQELARTAYHEAGHALVAVLKGMPVSKVSILSRGNALGVTWTRLARDDETEQTERDLLNEIMCFYGGYVAEKLIFQDVTPGVCDDLKKAGLLANKMIKEFGMGEGELEAVVAMWVSSDVVKQQFDAAAIKLLTDALAQTKALLSAHRDKLTALAQALLEHETLCEAEVAAIVAP